MTGDIAMKLTTLRPTHYQVHIYDTDDIEKVTGSKVKVSL